MLSSCSPLCGMQVKLREMLHKGKKDQKGPVAGEEPGAPDAYRTAVCCQVSGGGAGRSRHSGAGGERTGPTFRSWGRLWVDSHRLAMLDKLCA